MHLRPIYRYVTVIVLLSVTIFLSCSKNPTDNNTGNSDLAVLSVIPANAAPGVTLTVSGFSIDTTKITNYTLFIGDQQSLLITDSVGGISTIAPMFFADSTNTWPTPPTSAISIEIYLDSSLVAIGNNIFTVDSLVQSPGATLELVNNTITTVESYKTILRLLPTEPGYFEQMAFGITAGLDSLMYGGDSSLTTLLTELQSSAPEAVALIDAIYSSSGAVEQSQQIADAMASLADTLSGGNLKSSALPSDDITLAAMMQLSTMLQLYGDAFIHGAAQDEILFGTWDSLYSTEKRLNHWQTKAFAKYNNAPLIKSQKHRASDLHSSI